MNVDDAQDDDGDVDLMPSAHNMGEAEVLFLDTPPAEARQHLTQHTILSNTVSVGGVRGRVKVFVRPRPLDATLLKERGGKCVTFGGEEQDEITVTDENGKENHFSFDRVYGLESTNQQLFDDIGRPLVNSVMCGYNGTLMAYGQTGTGKTHTLSSEEGDCRSELLLFLPSVASALAVAYVTCGGIAWASVRFA
eukprot:3471039-Pleurochrysis_carterae.AAC.2